MKKVVIDFDDFEDKNNGLDTLFYWKSKYPNFKVTLFAIPGKTSTKMLKLIDRNKDWIQLGVHGFLHSSNFECLYWTADKTNAHLDFAESTGYFQKIFRAPGWQITYPQPYNESFDLSKPVNSYPQLVFNILKERSYIVCDQHYNLDKRPENLKVYCTCNPLFVHGHIQNIDAGEPNGLKQMEEQGVLWDEDTEFKFISELTDEELKCQH